MKKPFSGGRSRSTSSSALCYVVAVACNLGSFAYEMSDFIGCMVALDAFFEASNLTQSAGRDLLLISHTIEHTIDVG